MRDDEDIFLYASTCDTVLSVPRSLKAVGFREERDEHGTYFAKEDYVHVGNQLIEHTYRVFRGIFYVDGQRYFNALQVSIPREFRGLVDLLAPGGLDRHIADELGELSLQLSNIFHYRPEGAIIEEFEVEEVKTEATEEYKEAEAPVLKIA